MEGGDGRRRRGGRVGRKEGTEGEGQGRRRGGGGVGMKEGGRGRGGGGGRKGEGGRGGKGEEGGEGRKAGAESMRTDTGVVGKGGGGGSLKFCFFAVKWEGRRKSTTHLMDRNGLTTNNGKNGQSKGFFFCRSGPVSYQSTFESQQIRH